MPLWSLKIIKKHNIKKESGIEKDEWFLSIKYTSIAPVLKPILNYISPIPPVRLLAVHFLTIPDDWKFIF